jgi:CubicO group peptidase (beta-lactamase class C family)
MLVRRVSPGVAAAFSIAIAASAAPAQRASPTAIAHAVDSLARTALADGAGPALGVAIVMDGRPILVRAYGLGDADADIRVDDRTLWYLASTSKSITGVLAAVEVTAGRLDLQAPIVALIPQAAWHPQAQVAGLTLADFLGHTSGIAGGAVVLQAAFVGQVPEREWPALLRWSAPLDDRSLRYSNLGYNVAAMAIDRVEPDGWRAAADRLLFRPLGMRETYARLSGIDRRRIALPHRTLADGSYRTADFQKTDATMNSAGGHLSTLSDLARWTIAQMDSGRIEGRQALPAAAVALAQRQLAPQTIENRRRFAFFTRDGWGAGWDLGEYSGDRMVSRFGAYHSTRSHVSFLPHRRIGVVAMANGDNGFDVTDILAAFAYDLEAGRPDAHSLAAARMAEWRANVAENRRDIAQFDSTRAARQRQPLTHALAAFAGVYEHPGYGTIEFRMVEGSLHYRWGAISGPVESFDAAANRLRFEMAGGGTVASFSFAGEAVATQVTIAGNVFERR